MAMSGAERQRRYRERHHDIAHLTIDVHVDVRDQLDRLAWHYDCCLTELVEKLAAAAERHVEASLSGHALQQYRAGGYEDIR
jgi:macrodomain Ter protein organizer (MatP/YcbG family)